MKKFLFISLVALALFVSCSSTSKPTDKFDVSVQYELENQDISIDVTPLWLAKGVYSFDCKFINDSDKVCKVVWAESGIIYNDSSFIPFLEGQTFQNSQNPLSPMVIPANTTVHKIVYSADQIEITKKGWELNSIKDDNIKLAFMIQTLDSANYATITLQPKVVESKTIENDDEDTEFLDALNEDSSIEDKVEDSESEGNTETDENVITF